MIIDCQWNLTKYDKNEEADVEKLPLNYCTAHEQKTLKSQNVWYLHSKLVLCDVKFNLRYFFVLKQGNEQKEIDS